MTVRQVPPNINDPNLRGFLNELRSAIGKAGDQINRLTGDVMRLGGGGGGNPPGEPPPDPFGPDKPPIGDGFPPPAPTSLQAIPGAFSITLVWTNPVIPDLAVTEVWALRAFSAWDATYEYLANAKVLVNGTVYRSRKAQDVNSQTNVVTLNKGFNPPNNPSWWEVTTLAPTEPNKVGESAGTSWIHDGLTPGETWAYWVRNRDIENLFSTFFPPDDVGVIATTTLDPGAYLDLLTNSITATQLYSDLGKRINLIDGPLTIQPSCSIAGHATEAACKAAGGTWNPGSVAYRVAEEATARANGLAAEALARETGITNESTIRRTQDEQLAQTISVVNAKADNAAAAVISEQTARVTADGALGQRIDAVVATSNGNTAAITSEATARANADGALGSRIDTVVATTNTNTAAIQTETNARTTADSALSQRIDVVVAKAGTNAAAITSEATARANADGSLSQRIDQVQAVGNNNSALITDLEQAKIGYCSISSHTTKAACEDNGGTWYSQPLATAVKQVSVTANNGQTASLQQQFEAIYGTGGLRAQYTIKIDNAGWVSGFGLSSETQADGTVVSDFGIRADRFWIAPPSGNQQLRDLGFGLSTLGATRLVVRTAYGKLTTTGTMYWYAYIQTTTNSELVENDLFTLKHIRASDTTTSANLHYLFNGSFVTAAVNRSTLYDGSNNLVTLTGVTNAANVVLFRLDGNPGNGYTTSQSTGEFNDPARLVSNKNLPFVVTTTNQYYNGVLVEPGVYINAAWIVKASITNAYIYGHICSDNFIGGGGSTTNPHTTPGSAGWCINKNGNAALNNAAISGSMRSTVSGSPTLNWDTGAITNDGTAGWAIGKNGDAIFNTVIVRKPINVGNNSQIKVVTLTNSTVYTGLNGGASRSWSLGSYTFLGQSSQTRSMTFTLDMECALPTNSISATISLNTGVTWPLTFFYKGGSEIDSRSYSGTLSFPSTTPATSFSASVTANIASGYSSGTARMGDIRLTIIEALG